MNSIKKKRNPKSRRSEYTVLLWKSVKKKKKKNNKKKSGMVTTQQKRVIYFNFMRLFVLYPYEPSQANLSTYAKTE